ncbi:WecB/TagA/CpsF family glycosyltransferase [Ferrimonas balearica]|uniref:WecB/TagA/CpsF family glycosyltransferase n=1 Tax=Ferrimonas balearica TaxID=44012 RepID=UPI001C592B99|nr:WecB/TagA/CpsF family glycosyltransferase [Ferrimonas balearica]MBW3138220.1 WecB/TagA/CpsF family glycosyltransferase [Ferrimonas balearica]
MSHESIVSVNAFGYSFYGGSEGNFINQILGEIKVKRKITVFTPNVDFLVRAEKDNAFKSILKNSDYLVCDGLPISAFHNKFIRRGHLHRITGSTVTKILATKAYSQGLRVAFVGGNDGVAVRAAKKIMLSEGIAKPSNERIPIFSFCPEFGFEKSERLTKELVNLINEFDPDFLFFGVGSPKQEKWICENIDNLSFGAAFGIGASFDFIAGSKSRAPEWVQKSGAEWIWRMAQEPTRLGPRYLKAIFPFLALCTKSIFKSWKY